MNKLLIVVKETYLRQVKSWTFLAMILGPFLFIGLSFGFGWVSAQSAQSGSSDQIAVISQESELKQLFKANENFTDSYTDEAAAQKAVKAEKLAGYLTVNLEAGQLQAVYHGSESLTDSSRSTLAAALEAYQNQLNRQAAGLTADQAQVLSRQAKFTEEISRDKLLEKLANQFTTYIFGFMLYFIALIYLSVTAQDIAGEKGTKIMEVIFSSIPAPLYFYGRILGILAVIATHIGIYVGGGFIIYQIALQFDGVRKIVTDFQPLIDTILGNFSVSTVLFFIFGIFIYVILAALCGSLVTRAEEANKAVQPLTMVVMLAFIGVIFLGQMGDPLLLKIGSYVPLLSTFFMPNRLMNGGAGALEGWLSLLILIATTAGLVFYIGRSYAGLILQTDDIGLWKSFKKGISTR